MEDTKLISGLHDLLQHLHGQSYIYVKTALNRIESQDERIWELEQTIAYLESVRGCDLIGAEAENFQKLMDKNYQDYLVRNNIPNKQR